MQVAKFELDKLEAEIDELERQLLVHIKEFGLQPGTFNIKITLEYLDRNMTVDFELREDE